MHPHTVLLVDRTIGGAAVGAFFGLGVLAFLALLQAGNSHGLPPADNALVILDVLRDLAAWYAGASAVGGVLFTASPVLCAAKKRRRSAD